MENRLKRLFDFQRFEGNPRLAKMIAETEAFDETELSEEELFNVNAAGEASDTFPDDIDGVHGAPVRPR